MVITQLAHYGEHFSPRVLVSATSALCVNTFGAGTPNGNCNENQFSQPFTGQDGALYVAFANFNNATKDASDNHNQMLLAKSTDGGQTFHALVQVSDHYALPYCAPHQVGQDPGRACVPAKGSTTNSVFRATNYPVGAVNPTDAKQVIVTFGSYSNLHSNEANGCVPTGVAADGNDLYTGVKTPGACNNDILLSVSNDGGATFTGTTRVHSRGRTVTHLDYEAYEGMAEQVMGEIAEALFLSKRTVQVHVAHILAKTRSDNRAAASSFAQRHGLA